MMDGQGSSSSTYVAESVVRGRNEYTRYLVITSLQRDSVHMIGVHGRKKNDVGLWTNDLTAAYCSAYYQP